MQAGRDCEIEKKLLILNIKMGSKKYGGICPPTFSSTLPARRRKEKLTEN